MPDTSHKPEQAPDSPEFERRITLTEVGTLMTLLADKPWKDANRGIEVLKRVMGRGPAEHAEFAAAAAAVVASLANTGIS